MGTKEEKRELSQLRGAAVEHLKFGADLTKASAKLPSARVLKRLAKARSKLHQQLFARGLKALGMDRTAIDAIHATENKALQKYASDQRRLVRRHALELKRRQKQRARHVIKHRRAFEWEGGNPVYLTCAWTASSVDMDAFFTAIGDIQDEATAEGFGVNSCRFRDRTADDSSDHMAGVERTCLYQFDYRTPQKGVVRASSIVQVAGLFEVEAPFDCFSTTRARVRLTARLSATFRAGGETLTVNGPSAPVLDEEMTEGSGGVVIGNPGPIETGEVGLEFPEVLMDAGTNVVFTVSVKARTEAKNGGVALLDVGSDPAFGITIPAVWITSDG